MQVCEERIRAWAAVPADGQKDDPVYCAPGPQSGQQRRAQLGGVAQEVPLYLRRGPTA